LLLVVGGVSRGDLRTSCDRSLRNGLFLVLGSCEINWLLGRRIPVLGHLDMFLSLDLDGRLDDLDGEVDNLALTKLVPSIMLHE